MIMWLPLFCGYKKCIYIYMLLYPQNHQNNNLNGYSFGETADGQPGYRKPGADTIFPFRSQNASILAEKIETLGNGAVLTYTFSRSIPMCIAIYTHTWLQKVDTDVSVCTITAGKVSKLKKLQMRYGETFTTTSEIYLITDAQNGSIFELKQTVPSHVSSSILIAI